MATSQLSLYNNALALIGQRRLTDLTEDRAPRYLLDDIWALDSVKYCLEVVKPIFARDTVKLSTPAVHAEHDLDSVHTLPSNFITIVGVYSDAKLDQPIDRYLIDGDKIACEYATIYLRYVSNALLTTYTSWTASFARVVASYLGKEVAVHITPSKVDSVSQLFLDRVEATITLDNAREPAQRVAIPITQTVDKLSLYNNALMITGTPNLTSLLEDSEPRYLLDGAYNLGAVDYCLDIIKPVFARKTVTLNTPATSPNHGLDNVHTLPADFLSIVGVYSDSKLDQPISRYIIDGTTVACEYSVIYVRYVSDTDNDTFTAWSSSFMRAVGAYLARETSIKLAPENIDAIETVFTDRVEAAKSIENDQEPIQRVAIPTSQTVDKLSLYNNALMIVGHPNITDLSEDSEARYLLDGSYNLDAVRYCLEIVKPVFARKTAVLASPSTSSEHGLDSVHDLPSDFITIVGVYSDDKLDQSISRYIVDGRTVACEHATIYIRYVSDDPVYGFSDWVPSFTRVVSGYLAREVSIKLASPEKLEAVGIAYGDRVEAAIALADEQEPQERSSKPTVTLTNEWRHIYNDALLILGRDEITSNDDDSDRRVKLDTVLSTGIVSDLLQDTAWTFALKSVKAQYDPSLESRWGYSRVIAHPNDMHRLDGVFVDEYMQVPLKLYKDEDKKFYSDQDEVYLQYVTKDFLVSPDTWPMLFKKLVAGKMAKDAAKSLGADYDRVKVEFEDREDRAKSNDAMAAPPRIISNGRWSRGRFSYRGTGRDRP